MRNRLARITSEIKKYDRALFCSETSEGIPAIFRKTVRQEVFDMSEDEKASLVVFKDSHQLVFPLTDTWKVTGKIVDWGIEPILARLKAMDLWNNESLTEDLIKSYEKTEQTRAKDHRNNIESFFSDMRGTFKKDWSDINTSSMAKKDKRHLTDKRIKGV